MKIKLTLIFTVFLMVSCVKDRNCTCTTVSAAGVSQEVIVYRGKRKAAKAACELRSNSNNGNVVTCELTN